MVRRTNSRVPKYILGTNNRIFNPVFRIKCAYFSDDKLGYLF